MTVESEPIGLPRVAVVIDNFNQGRFCVEALRSVAAQTYRDFTCVVVDDASTDGSAATIEAELAALADPRFQFIRRARNGGQMATLMTGLDATDAPFVAFLDADDVWLPHHLERHLEVHLNTKRLAALTTSNLYIVDKAGRLIAGAHPSFVFGELGRTAAEQPERIDAATPFVASSDGPVLGSDRKPAVFVPRSMPSWIWSVTSAMVFRRSVLALIRPDEPEDIRTSADNYLARFAHLVGGTLRIEEPLGLYRMHGANAFAVRDLYGSGLATGSMPTDLRATIDRAIARRLLTQRSLFEPVLTMRQLRRVMRLLVEKRHVLASLGDLPEAVRLLGRGSRTWFRLRYGFARRYPFWQRCG